MIIITIYCLEKKLAHAEKRSNEELGDLLGTFYEQADHADVCSENGTVTLLQSNQQDYDLPWHFVSYYKLGKLTL